MTKVTMPEPVAWRSKYKSEPGMLGQYPWSYVERSLRQPALNNYDIEALITTDQAEAYANAEVREALKEAAMILKANAEVCHSDTGIMLRANAEAIRALIPTDNATMEQQK